ncbi:MAG: glycosyl transferase [Planctomycetaceae bacterium]|nr:glycosyl transferase [Planctomycetaceae bacterium]
MTDPKSESDPHRPLPEVSLILPVFNEAQNLGSLLDGLQIALKHCCKAFEIVVVNDGSTDGTRDILRGRTDIRLLEHPVNRGYGAALKTGIRLAKYPIIAISDADGTYPPEHLANLLLRMNQADMVVGARTGAEVQYPMIRGIPKWFLVRFAEWMARQRIPDLNSGLRVFQRDIAQRFLKILPDGFSFTTTITLAMLTNGYLVEYESINYRARTGRSKIRPIRDTLGMLRTILFTGMYFAPLRVFLPIAAFFSFGFLCTVTQDIIYRDLTERTLILFVAATQFGMFALLAEMIDKRSP